VEKLSVETGNIWQQSVGKAERPLAEIELTWLPSAEKADGLSFIDLKEIYFE
jgi:hypothetical protein